MAERDLQGAGGGGGGFLETNAYTNQALNISSNSVQIDKQQIFKGSNDFILVDEKDHVKTEDTLQQILHWAQRRLKGACTKKVLHKRLPILNWLPTYNSEKAIGDLIAGVTVGLTVIPQALAYANIAGLPLEYGLYGSFLGCFVYIFFGSCKDVPVGPTAIASIMTFQALKGHGVEHAILLCFLTGLVQIFMGVFGLGFLIDFVSGPVSSGFTSAVALIIVTSQVKDILGIVVTGNTFLESWISVFQNIKDTKPWDTIFGISCIAFLLIMKIVASLKIGPTKSEDTEPSRCQKFVNNLIWLIGTSRNAILVIICGAIGYSFATNGDVPFRVIGSVPSGLPKVSLPSFGYTKETNGTSEYVPFVDMVSNLSFGIFVVPLLGLLEDIAICKAFSRLPVDATQELIAIGMANLANSFVQAFPGSGSLSRSAVSNCSGVKTPLSGLYTSLIVVVALVCFTPYFYYIPKATLAAILIAAVVFMVEVKVVKPMWRSKKSDLIPGVGTFIACLVLPLEIGIFIGIGINLLFILYHAARPKISVEKLTSQAGIEYLLLTPDRCLIFPSVDYVRNLVTKHSIRQGIPVVIDCTHIYGADYTAATVIETLTQDFVGREQPLFFYNLKPSVSSVFEGLSPKEFVVYYNEEEIDDLLKNKSYIKKQICQV